MPRIVNCWFDDSFRRQCKPLIGAAREHAPGCAPELRQVGGWLDTEHSEAIVGQEQEKKFELWRRRDASSMTPPNYRGPRRARVTPQLPGDGLRADRIEHSFRSLLVRNQSGEILRLLGENLPRGEREANALRVVVVVGCIVDPDAGEWLSSVTSLADAPWTSNRSVSPWVKGRADVACEWGHDAFLLLREAIGALGWNAVIESSANVDDGTHNLPPEPLSVGQQIDRAIGLLERAEKLRNEAQAKAMLAAAQGRSAALQTNSASVLGSAGEMNALKFRFDAIARPFVQVAYALNIEAAALDDFIRTGQPHLVGAAIRVLRLVQAGSLQRTLDGNQPSSGAVDPRALGAQPITVSDRGHELLRFLATQTGQMYPVADLPPGLLDADLLTVMDADGLIEFGRRVHVTAGGSLIVEAGWEFVSITGPNKKSMADFIAECIGWQGDERILEHVRLTARGRLEASRVVLSTQSIDANQVNVKPTTMDGMTWQEAKAKAELHVKRNGDVFPGRNTLAELIGCAKATMTKAIRNSSYLRARQAEREQGAKAREVPWSVAIAESLSDEAHDDQNELQRLIAEQQAETRRDERQSKAAAKARSQGGRDRSQ